MRDRRRGWVCQTLPALNALRARFDGRTEEDGKKLSLNTALGIYLVLTELANEARSDDDFRASHGQIAALAGSTRQTVSRYLVVFCEIRLLMVERVTGRNGDEPNSYALIDPDATEMTPGVASDDTQGVNSGDTITKKEEVPLASLGAEERARRERANEECVEKAKELWPKLTEPQKAVMKELVAVSRARLPDPWKPETLVELCQRYADRDHAAEAEAFRFWYVEGTGENTPVKSLAGRWRTWLDRAPTAGKRKLHGPKNEKKQARDERQARRRAAIDRLTGRSE